MNQSKDIINILFGFISLASIIYGFLIEEFKILFWSIGSALLIVVVLSYYVMDNRDKILRIQKKFRKIEESLNIYYRLNKIELKIENEQKRTNKSH